MEHVRNHVQCREYRPLAGRGSSDLARPVSFAFMSTRQRVAVITGGNRGMGLETCRQLARHGHRVVLTSRDGAQGEKAAASLTKEGLEVHARTLDVTDAASITRLARKVEKEFGGTDVLVNNAALYLDEGTSVLDVTMD